MLYSIVVSRYFISVILSKIQRWYLLTSSHGSGGVFIMSTHPFLINVHLTKYCFIQLITSINPSSIYWPLLSSKYKPISLMCISESVIYLTCSLFFNSFTCLELHFSTGSSSHVLKHTSLRTAGRSWWVVSRRIQQLR